MAEAAPKRSRRAKAGVTNGARLLVEKVDHRSEHARRYRDLQENLVAHVGGDPTDAQMILIRRIAALTVWAECEEAKLLNSQEPDIGAMSTAANTVRRLLQDLGLKRAQLDVTPTTMGDRIMDAPQLAAVPDAGSRFMGAPPVGTIEDAEIVEPAPAAPSFAEFMAARS